MPHFKAGVQYRIPQTCHFPDVMHLGFHCTAKIHRLCGTYERPAFPIFISSIYCSADVAAVVGNAFPKASARFLPSIDFNLKER